MINFTTCIAEEIPGKSTEHGLIGVVTALRIRTPSSARSNLANALSSGCGRWALFGSLLGLLDPTAA